MSQVEFGRYRLLKLLARGGMAEIFLALETTPLAGERYVVIKRILPKFVEDPDFTEFFVDEGRVCLALSHPNIVQAYELGCEQGSYYLALEYVRGESLISALRRATVTERLLAIPLVIHIGRSIAAALDHAHTACDVRGRPLEVIHRDVSPHNILLGYDGVVKLADFGIARATSQSHRTLTGVVKGKYAYLAPEALPMVEGQIDQRIDIFALGIVLHETIVRRPLFRGQNDSDTIQRIVRGRIPTPAELRNDCPEALSRVVMRALERDPSRRYQTAAEMLADLEQVSSHARSGTGLSAARDELSALFQRRPTPEPARTTPALSARPRQATRDDRGLRSMAQLALEKRTQALAAESQQARASRLHDAVTRQQPTLEVLSPVPEVEADSASELVAAPSTSCTTRPRLPLPPPARGGSAPVLPDLSLPPPVPPPLRAFRFGTQPRVLGLRQPAPGERDEPSQPLRMGAGVPPPLPERAAHVDTGEFGRVDEPSSRGMGGSSGGAGRGAVSPLIDVSLAALVMASVAAVRHDSDQGAGEMMTPSPAPLLPALGAPPPRRLRWAGPLAALATMLVVVFVARPLRHRAAPAGAAALVAPVPSFPALPSLWALAWELARSLR